jgi:hypothetical protein
MNLERAGVFGVALLAACATPTIDPQSYLHMICVDKDGGPAALRVRSATERHETPLDLHVQDIAECYWRECVERCVLPCDYPITLVVHGGLVGMGESVPETQRLLAAMTRPGEEVTFPIFVNWETGMVASYLNHLLWVRDGRDRVSGLLTMPFLLIEDVGRALVRFPVTLFTNQRRDFVESYLHERPQAIPTAWRESCWIDTAGQGTSGWATARDIGQEVLPGLARVVTTPLLEMIGHSAYLDMIRRARVLFLRDEDFDAGHFRPTGALCLLMEELLGNSDHKQHVLRRMRRELEVEWATTSPEQRERRNRLADEMVIADRILNSNEFGHENLPFANYGEPTFRIFAHSMGTLVANTLVQRFGDEATFERIVYMGAACSIRDFTDELVPYIVANPQCEFYNVCLHPSDEIGEWSWGGIAPHGSLLVWIDSYITTIHTELDLTLGRWNNIMRALPITAYLTSDVRRRIHVRGFGRGGHAPHEHGSFNDVEYGFWRRTFYDAGFDPSTAARLSDQVASDRLAGSGRNLLVDIVLRRLQRAFDRSLAMARSEAEVAMIYSAYVERAGTPAEAELKELARESSRSVPNLELDRQALLSRWRLQAAARKSDLRRDARGTEGSTRTAWMQVVKRFLNLLRVELDW